MKYATSTLGLISLSSVLALPAPDVEPVRILPANWRFNITSLRGPGCPKADIDPIYENRLTFGENTVDGSEIYYWFVAYPRLRVDVDGQDHTWCETELSYTEFADVQDQVKSDKYRLRLHKNGTRGIATWDLEKGVSAKWEITYDIGHGNELTDSITLEGPTASGDYAQQLSSPVSKKPELIPLPQCGAGAIKFRTDLYIEGKEGKKGFVASETHKNQAGTEGYYGTQLGFSYDWEKCFTSGV